MIDFITFSVTLPYPTLKLINWYVIIGGLLSAGIFIRLVVTSHDYWSRGDTKPFHEIAMGVSIFMLGWPYIVYLYLKETRKANR